VGIVTCFLLQLLAINSKIEKNLNKKLNRKKQKQEIIINEVPDSLFHLFYQKEFEKHYNSSE
jgi:hypothetical protein